MPSASLEDRLWSRVKPNGNGCWEFQGSRNRQGYGYIKENGKNARAHRVAYRLAVGPIPDGMVICHSCDNPPCCNPAHLFVGTYSDNARDTAQKGRSVIPDGGAYMRSKTHCVRGHEFTPENTRVSNGKRKCRACNRVYQHEKAALAAFIRATDSRIAWHARRPT